jgi:hypothetical protein
MDAFCSSPIAVFSRAVALFRSFLMSIVALSADVLSTLDLLRFLKLLWALSPHVSVLPSTI